MKLLGPDELVPIVWETIKANPGNRNPRPSPNDGCVYTDKNGCHCLVGEVGERLNWRVPTNRSRYNREPAFNVALHMKWPITTSGAEFLQKVQDAADSDFDTRSSVKWGSIKLRDLKKMAADV